MYCCCCRCRCYAMTLVCYIFSHYISSLYLLAVILFLLLEYCCCSHQAMTSFERKMLLNEILKLGLGKSLHTQNGISILQKIKWHWEGGFFFCLFSRNKMWFVKNYKLYYFLSQLATFNIYPLIFFFFLTLVCVTTELAQLEIILSVSDLNFFVSNFIYKTQICLLNNLLLEVINFKYIYLKT